jgi:hypothetical protein
MLSHAERAKNLAFETDPTERGGTVRGKRKKPADRKFDGSALRYEEVVKLWKGPDGTYFRIRDKNMFPSMKNIEVTMSTETIFR